MGEDPQRDQELLGVEDVAERLGVQAPAVHRWCREGRLQCLKPGKAWRIRASSLNAFLEQGERPRTLCDHLWTFISVPDHLVGLADDAALMQRLDAAYFQVGEARGTLLVKFIGSESATIAESLRPQRTGREPVDFNPPTTSDRRAGGAEHHRVLAARTGQRPTVRSHAREVLSVVA